MNAHLERFFGSLKSECLDCLIVFREKAMHNAVRQLVAHDHAERPHQGLCNELIEPLENARLCMPTSNPENDWALRSYWRTARSDRI
jgi:transposase InsO family protein